MKASMNSTVSGCGGVSGGFSDESAVDAQTREGAMDTMNCGFTAHASADGVALLGEDGVVIVLSFDDGQAYTMGKEKADRISSGANEIVDYVEEPEAAWMTETNFGELKEARINYRVTDLGDTYDGFVLEHVTVEHNGEQFSYRVPGELRAVREVETPNITSDNEPLLLEEAIEFSQTILGDKHFITEIGIKADVLRASEACKDYADAIDFYNWRRSRWVRGEDGQWRRPKGNGRTWRPCWLGEDDKALPYPRWEGYRIKFFGEMPETVAPEDRYLAKRVWQRQYDEVESIMSRVRSSARKWDTGSCWSMDGNYFIGERHGVTDIVEELSLATVIRKSDQINDDDLQDELVEARETNLYHQLFYMGGEELPSARRNADGTERKTALPGENKLWSDWFLYMAREKARRVDNFARALFKIMFFPLESVEKRARGQIFQKYNDSVKANAPGPERAKVNGRWRNVPLEGRKAYEYLKATGLPKQPRNGEPARVRKTVKFHKCASWHKLWVSREHKDMLIAAIERRLGEVRVQYGDEVVVEEVPTYQGWTRQELAALGIAYQNEPLTHEYAEGDTEKLLANRAALELCMQGACDWVECDEKPVQLHHQKSVPMAEMLPSCEREVFEGLLSTGKKMESVHTQA